MDINQADTTAAKAMAFNEEKNLVIASFVSGRECMEKGNDLLPVLEVAAGEFTHDERVSTDFLCFQERCKAFAGRAKVVDPYGGIDKDHLNDLRRGIRCA